MEIEIAREKLAVAVDDVGAPGLRLRRRDTRRQVGPAIERSTNFQTIAPKATRQRPATAARRPRPRSTACDSEGPSAPRRPRSPSAREWGGTAI